MSQLTILVKLQDVITIFPFHFGHGGHFQIMQIGIIYGFVYITFYLQWRKSFEYDVCSHFEFRYSNLGGYGLL